MKAPYGNPRITSLPGMLSVLSWQPEVHRTAQSGTGDTRIQRGHDRIRAAYMQYQRLSLNEPLLRADAETGRPSAATNTSDAMRLNELRLNGLKRPK